MKTLTTLGTLYTSLSNNTSATNLTLGKQLINDQQRYLLQKYFNNERTVTTTTIGGQALVLTATPAIGDTSATLNTNWTLSSVSQLVNFSSGDQRLVSFTKNSTAITWADGLLKVATTAITTVGVQAYSMPANISKPKDVTINVGQLKYVPKEIMTRAEWDLINFLPYTSNIPQYYFVYNNQINFFPIPSTTGNIITYNFKVRVADMNYVDFSTGNIANAGMTIGSTIVTGTGTTWNSVGTFPLTADLTFQNLNLRVDPPYGDGIWYPIQSFQSDTALTLQNPVINAPNITGSSTYTIGQIPILAEDFHDMLVFGALKIYFSSVAENQKKFKEFEALYEERLTLLEEYAGTKSVNVDLGQAPDFVNPNLFIYSN